MEKKLRVLIVEDDQLTREMYADVFQRKGIDVLVAQDGKEGLEIAAKEIPDVVFTGISMPRMSGFELMEALKKTEATAKIPVVISSHLGKEADRRKANELGAREFIVRGFTPPNQVAERLKELFESSGTYQLPFDASSADANQIAKDLKLNNNFLCVKCGTKMILELKLKDANRKIFEARLICPNCGEEAK